MLEAHPPPPRHRLRLVRTEIRHTHAAAGIEKAKSKSRLQVVVGSVGRPVGASAVESDVSAGIDRRHEFLRGQSPDVRIHRSKPEINAVPVGSRFGRNRLQPDADGLFQQRPDVLENRLVGGRHRRRTDNRVVAQCRGHSPSGGDKQSTYTSDLRKHPTRFHRHLSKPSITT